MKPGTKISVVFGRQVYNAYVRQPEGGPVEADMVHYTRKPDNTWGVVRYQDRGRAWTHGWDGELVDALRVAAALS